MREIKFRTFDGAIMHSWEELLDENVSLKILNSNNKIMQYTGLKDKNSAEIYEGDVVSVFGSPFKIVFYEGCFGYWIWENEAYRKFITSVISNNVDDVEVIGNIYENKDLLEKHNG